MSLSQLTYLHQPLPKMRTPLYWTGRKVDHLDWRKAYDRSYEICDFCQRFFHYDDSVASLSPYAAQLIDCDLAYGYCDDCYDGLVAQVEKIDPTWMEYWGNERPPKGVRLTPLQTR